MRILSGAHTYTLIDECQLFVHLHSAYEPHPLTEVLCYSASNVVTQSKYAKE